MQFHWSRLNPPTTRRFVGYALHMHMLVATIGCGMAYVLLKPAPTYLFGASVVVINIAVTMWMLQAMRDVVVDDDVIRRTISGRTRVFAFGFVMAVVLMILLALWLLFLPPSWQPIVLFNMFFGLMTGNLVMLRNLRDGHGAAS